MLSGIERHLLQHREDERFISRRSRSQQHMRVLAFGYIKEHVVDAGARSAPRSSVAAVSKQVCGAWWMAGPLIKPASKSTKKEKTAEMGGLSPSRCLLVQANDTLRRD